LNAWVKLPIWGAWVAAHFGLRVPVHEYLHCVQGGFPCQVTFDGSSSHAAAQSLSGHAWVDPLTGAFVALPLIVGAWWVFA